MLKTAKPVLLKLRTGVSVGILAIALSACGTTKWGFPYRADVQQGNWITSEQVGRLEKGMTREQVRFILGTPTLQDIFRSNRWDYPYYSKPGYGKPEERKFTVWFNGDLLERWEGDQQPDRQPFQKQDTGAEQPKEAGNSKEATKAEAADTATDASENGATTRNSNVELNGISPRGPIGSPSPSSPQPLR